jgi:phage-related minor tail protein
MVQSSLAQAKAQEAVTAASAQATAQIADTARQYQDVAASADRAATSTTNYNKSFGQGSGGVQSASATTAALAAQRAEMARLAGEIDPTIKALAKLDAQERQLNTLRKSGAVGDEDYARFKGLIDEARASITGAGQAMHTFNLNTSQARLEMGRLIKDIATGQWDRLGQSSMTLANQAGAMSALFSPLGIAITAVVASLAAFLAMAESVAVENDKLNASIQLTGNYAGTTSSQIVQLAQALSTTKVGVGQATDILNTLVASGRVSGQSLQSMGQAAVDMAALTGESAEKAADAVLKLFDGTAEGAVKANEQYHFLTTSIYDQIKAFQEAGDTQAAIDLEARAFHDAAVQRLQAESDQISGLARWWQDAKANMRAYYEDLKTRAALTLGTATDQQQLDALQEKKLAAKNGAGSTISDMLFGNSAVWTPQDQQQLDTLTQKIADAKQKASLHGLNTQLATGAVEAKADLDRMGQSLDRNAAKQAEINKLDGDFLKLWKGADAGDRDLQGVQAITNEDGSVSFSGGLYDQRRAEIDKKYQTRTAKPKSDKAAEDAQEQLIKLLNDEQGAIDPVAKAWATYNDKVAQANALADKAKTANGANAEAIDAERNAVIAAAAAARDAQLDEPAKKAREAFEKLLQSLKDVNGLKLDGLRAQLQTLKDDLDKGVISASEYHQAVQGVLNTQLKPLPTYKGVGSSVGGSFGELDKINVAGNELDKQYAAELAALVDQNQKKLLLDEDFVTKENALYTDYYAKKQQLQDASNDVLMTGVASALAQSANAVKESVGKNTEAYRIAFAASKAAAIAQASINLGKAISNAGADVPFPANIAAMATVGAQMIALISQITSVQAGFSEGGYTGPGGKYQVKGYVHAGEGVLSQENIAAMGGPAAFEAFRAGLNGYADGGYVGANWLPVPVAQPEPRLSADAANAAAARNAASGGNPEGSTHIHVWSIEEAAEKLAASPTMEKAVVHIVGDNPRTIQGKWRR